MKSPETGGHPEGEEPRASWRGKVFEGSVVGIIIAAILASLFVIFIMALVFMGSWSHDPARVSPAAKPAAGSPAAPAPAKEPPTAGSAAVVPALPEVAPDTEPPPASTLVLGDPLVFDASNIDRYDF